MDEILKKFGIAGVCDGAYGNQWITCKGNALLEIRSPIDVSLLGSIATATTKEYEQVIRSSHETFLEWRKVPAPERGQLVREIAAALRERKDELGLLVTREVGKIRSEGLGEVQEAIDIADFAVGLSRQLCGSTMHSERRNHRMYEQWHPLGPVGVITAFNFPVAVWAWNAMLAAVCGDTVIWKPSEYAPFCAYATHLICAEVAARRGFPGLFSLLIGNGPELGVQLAADPRVPLISATGSCRMGRAVAKSVSARLGRSILELGGNNAVVVLEDADLDLALRSVLFGAVGTAGQRCTTTRRLLIHYSVKNKFVEMLKRAYAKIAIGDPRHEGILMGPLIHANAVKGFEHAIERIKAEGGEIVYGGKVLSNMSSALYVEPTLVLANATMEIVKEETFAPILYVIEISDVQDAIAMNNGVSQGLSSAIFTRNVVHAEEFLAATGSDCGIANVNIGTSGAEIGGAFGGEKETGGGRESGSDSWKQYMRRQTNTINYGSELPLAQGVRFDVEA
jgi:aldehyde dehydrogenase (NAD+)